MERGWKVADTQIKGGWIGWGWIPVGWTLHFIVGVGGDVILYLRMEGRRRWGEGGQVKGLVGMAKIIFYV